LIGTATPASPGTVQGRAVFTWQEACSATDNGEDVILVRHETSPDDIDGMNAALGILTSVGGLVSHAAVVARAWEKPCVVGFSDMTIMGMEARVGDNFVIDPSSIIRINGSTGAIHLVEGK
jgi:pyruvate,orthophosphate dikinase